MKGLVLATALLISVSSHAQIRQAYQKVKQAVTGSAKISQPHYFVAQWELLAQGGFTLANKDFKYTSGTGFDGKSEQQTLNLGLTLGVLDFLSLGLKWDYDINNKYTYDGNISSANYKGINDPVFAILGRAGDFDAVKIDLKFAYQPKTGDAKLPDATHDANALNGYRTTTLGAEIDFLVTDASQVFLAGNHSTLSERIMIDQTTNTVLTGKSVTSTRFEIGTLTEIVNDSFFGITFALLNEKGARTVQADATTTIETPEITASLLTFAGKHEFTPDSALSLELEYILNGTLKDSNSEIKLEGQAVSAQYLVRF